MPKNLEMVLSLVKGKDLSNIDSDVSFQAVKKDAMLEIKTHPPDAKVLARKEATNIVSSEQGVVVDKVDTYVEMQPSHSREGKSI